MHPGNSQALYYQSLVRSNQNQSLNGSRGKVSRQTSLHPSIGTVHISTGTQHARHGPNDDANEGLERPNETGSHILQHHGGELLVVVLQRPLRAVELAQIALGLHKDKAQPAPLAAHDLVHVLIGDVDLGSLASFTKDDTDGELQKLDEEDAQVQPAQVVRGQEAQLGVGGGLADRRLRGRWPARLAFV